MFHRGGFDLGVVDESKTHGQQGLDVPFRDFLLLSCPDVVFDIENKFSPLFEHAQGFDPSFGVEVTVTLSPLHGSRVIGVQLFLKCRSVCFTEFPTQIDCTCVVICHTVSVGRGGTDRVKGLVSKRQVQGVSDHDPFFDLCPFWLDFYTEDFSVWIPALEFEDFTRTRKRIKDVFTPVKHFDKLDQKSVRVLCRMLRVGIGKIK